MKINFYDNLIKKRPDTYLVAIIFIFEVATVLSIAIGLLPREFSWIITAIIIVYIAMAKIKNSLSLVIISIPFYLALPVSSNFDTLTNWRIIFIALVLAWIIKEKIIQKIPRENILSRKNLKEFFQKNPLYFWLMSFVIISILSLVGASEVTAGIKKILFLINIFIIFFVVKSTIKDKKSFIKILKMSVFSGFSVLFIAYLQIITIFFYSLSHFWQFWAEKIITALYGQSLSNLLSYSNTWFSYYTEESVPTLRMFSVFPDSHSFALFNIILLPFIITLIWHYKNNNASKLIAYFIILSISLFAIILSGSRGAWVGAAAPLAITLLLIGKEKVKNTGEKIKILIKQNSVAGILNDFKNFSAKLKIFASYLIGGKLKIILSTIILFFILFPLSSVFLEQTQIAEWKRLNNGSDIEKSILSKRLKSIIDLDETSNKGRIEIWKDTLVSIKKHPIFGVGVGNFSIIIGENISAAKKGASAHNLFLDIFSEMGILGLLAFLGIFYQIAKQSYTVFTGTDKISANHENSNEETYKIFALSFMVYLSWVLGYALFDVVLLNDKVLILFSIAIGLLYGIKNINTQTSEKSTKF